MKWVRLGEPSILFWPYSPAWFVMIQPYLPTSLTVKLKDIKRIWKHFTRLALRSRKLNLIAMIIRTAVALWGTSCPFKTWKWNDQNCWQFSKQAPITMLHMSNASAVGALHSPRELCDSTETILVEHLFTVTIWHCRKQTGMKPS